MFKRIVGYLLIVVSIMLGLGMIIFPYARVYLLWGFGYILDPTPPPLPFELIFRSYVVALQSIEYWLCNFGVFMIWRIGKWLV